MTKEWPKRQFAESIGGLIASVRETEFPSLLRRFLASTLGFKNLVVIVFSRDSAPIDLYHWIPDREGFQFEEQYLKWSYQLDPYFKAIERGDSGVFLIRDVASDRFFQSEYGKSYFSSVRMIDELGLLVPISSRFTVNLALGREIGSNRFTKNDKRLLTEIAPILAPLLKIYAEVRLQTISVPPQDRGPESLTRKLVALVPRPGETMRLTTREAQIIALVMAGHSNASMAATLDISPQTVKVHRKHAYAKLNVSSQAELFLKVMPRLS